MKILNKLTVVSKVVTSEKRPLVTITSRCEIKLNKAAAKKLGLKNSDGSNRKPNYEEVKIGSLQRIADAVEKMASNYVALENERDLYKRWYKEQRQEIATLKKSKAALTGVINKLKKKQDQQPH